MGKQGPTVWNKGLYSVSCDKLQWKEYEKECLYV